MWVVFLAKGGRVLGKTVDQSCRDFNFWDPSLFPGAAVYSSVKTDGFCAGSEPGFCFSSPMLRRWKAGRGAICAVSGRGREQFCLLHDEFFGAVLREQSSVRRGGVVSSGAVVREQSSTRRVGDSSGRVAREQHFRRVGVVG